MKPYICPSCNHQIAATEVQKHTLQCLMARTLEVREIIDLAHEFGWDGVNNSKILSFFLRDRLAAADRCEKAIDAFLEWENDGDRSRSSPEEWLEQTERLAAALKGEV